MNTQYIDFPLKIPTQNTDFIQNLTTTAPSRTFEAGGHGLFCGNKNRASLALNHFGQHVEVPLKRGLAFIEWQDLNMDGTVKKTKAHQVGKGAVLSLDVRGRICQNHGTSGTNEPIDTGRSDKGDDGAVAGLDGTAEHASRDL